MYEPNKVPVSLSLSLSLSSLSYPDPDHHYLDPRVLSPEPLTLPPLSLPLPFPLASFTPFHSAFRLGCLIDDIFLLLLRLPLTSSVPHHLISPSTPIYSLVQSITPPMHPFAFLTAG